MPRPRLPITRPPCPFAHQGDLWLDGFYPADPTSSDHASSASRSRIRSLGSGHERASLLSPARGSRLCDRSWIRPALADLRDRRLRRRRMGEGAALPSRHADVGRVRRRQGHQVGGSPGLAERRDPHLRRSRQTTAARSALGGRRGFRGHLRSPSVWGTLRSRQGGRPSLPTPSASGLTHTTA